MPAADAVDYDRNVPVAELSRIDALLQVRFEGIQRSERNFDG
jgi:hypothetical protein